MAAYEILENDVMVHITYIESQPESNPTIAGHFREYSGIGRVLITYGIKLSIDHYCAVAPKNAEKARCDNHQQAFSCFGRNCAEPTKFTLQRWSVRACRSSPTRKARGSNPPGRTKSSTLWGAALFVLHGFYGAIKERIRTARAPRFASRGAETPRWGVSRARLGESLRARQKSPCNVLYAVKR